ncbi:hypothetical protein [Deinococcus actinosclerus]|uniref:hypothetical protein n=1 Tax=Deinococcus actinosclerus TaxID=1768108 RepID=UPI000B33985B|nr:hypothetical protein [Deinococcus actinosclerus]
MKLLTFGGLRVDSTTYRREKPLLLLAYLLLEGPQARRRLADLFWPDAANPMNSLAQNLIRLRPLNAITETEQRVEARLPCDAAEFRTHHRAARWTEACAAYTGEFLAGLRLDLPLDLEEWLLDTRDTLGSEARAAQLALADYHHARAEPHAAHAHAERAYRTPGAPPCPPEDLTRLWHILGGTDHPLTLHLRRDADDIGLRLTAPAPPTPDHTLIGRRAELDALIRLPTGSVAWISGPPGIGKTTLLRALTRHGWRLLPAQGQGGLPLATLEPLSPHPLSSAADALNLLRDTRLKLAVDDWEELDDTTRATLTLAARQTPGATIAITARHSPALPTPHHVSLQTLSEQDLLAHPGAHAATAGHPTLLAGYLTGAPPHHTLDAHLNLLGTDPRRLFLALAAQEPPNLAATRAALNLTATALTRTLDTLTREGLTTPDGRIRAPTSALHLLDAQPTETALIHLHLARHHPRETAWPHWLAARDLWEDHDQAACAAAAHWHADQDMKRGYPARAASVLEVAPQTDEVRLLRGWAMLRLGKTIILDGLVSCFDEKKLSDYAYLSLKSALNYKMGNYHEVLTLSDRLPFSNSLDRGVIYFYAACSALRLNIKDKARRSLTISRSIVECSGSDIDIIRVDTLNAILESDKNANIRDFYSELLKKSALFPIERGVLLINFADYIFDHEGPKSFGIVEEYYREAEKILHGSGNEEGAAAALNSWGVSAHLSNRITLAEELYKKGITLIRDSGNIRLLGLLTANLSEISGNIEKLDEILYCLNSSGHTAVVSKIINNLADIRIKESLSH